MDIRYSLTALDCPDPAALAAFYSRLTGFTFQPLDDVSAAQMDWIEIGNDAGNRLAFQKVASYVAPTWPEGPVPPQVHLDFDVDDLDEGEAFVLSLGARKPSFQPGDSFRVYLDPAGHPFCLVLSGES